MQSAFAQNLYMRKIQLIVLLLISATYLQSCKKDVTTSATTTSDKILSANINGTAWYPDTVSAKINFDDATKIKTFSVTGTYNAKRVTFTLNVPNSTAANNFPVASYRVDATDKLSMAYFEQQKDAGTGSLVFVQKGTVEPGSGTVTISSIDSTKNVITGTFSFTAKKVNTDPATGDIISIDIYQVLIGSFTNLPYLLNNND
jgi:hypothetical protein